MVDGISLTAAIRGLDAASQTPYVKSFSVDGCTIEAPVPMTLVALDGETILMETPIRFRLKHRALQVVVP